MHMRHFRLRIPVHPKLRLFWDRVTFSKLTTIYFCFSIIHCIVQVVFQVQAFGVNQQAVTFLSGLIKQGNATAPGFTVYDGSVLRVCEVVPSKALDASSCPIVWGGMPSNTSAEAAQGTGNNFNAQPSSSASSVASSANSSSSSAIASISSAASSSSDSATLSSADATSSSASASSSNSVISSSSSSLTSSAISSSSLLSISSIGTTSDAVSSSSAHSSASSTKSSEQPSSIVFTVPSPPPVPTGDRAVDSDASDSTASVTVTVRLSPSQQVTSLNNVATDGEDETKNNTGVANDSGIVGSTKNESQAAVDNAASGSSSETQKPPVENVQTPHVTSLKAPTRRDSTPGSISIPDRKVTVQLGGLNGLQEANLTEQCLFTLNWPVVSVENTKREDIAFVMFQFWLLGMSLVALLNESIPHIVASLLTHTLATAWGGFQIFNTNQFHTMFSHLTTKGACGINLLPDYWKARGNAEIPSLVLNCVAFLFSSFLTWRLMKAFGWQTFKRVGASRTINRVYNAVLILSISIQLALFFVATFAALWLDQVLNGSIGRLTHTKAMFIAISVLVLVLLVPWLTLGWISVRREHRLMALTFLVLSLAYLGGWASMFTAATFRWTFVQWTFFSLIASASVLLTFMTFVVGVICLFNFGKGLPRYLQAQEPLADDDFAPGVMGEKADMEKAEFPSNDLPIPTFSAAFGSGSEVPPPSQMRFGPPGRQKGPRFFNQSLEPFEAPSDAPPYSVNEASSYDSKSGDSALNRSDSGSSYRSDVSSEGSTSDHSTRSKRWVIE
ncbi:hypothetical protein OBBRIDRAFT_787278 [Obba rivulosa]|uniref:Uncharacterized protein n=1 Tax=Obba rivulosa TaxID=1052685 RepID=A0A8E2DVB9_9APHY|nr:hypothetical protein OBBRIDRAFT_787278 [Obba rivulosa]